ncbi:MAG: hypothetical protein P1U34_05340 [Coxiellaceae bacterium]|nr:hypothetical protein [Coxiellaceae bacterium]
MRHSRYMFYITTISAVMLLLLSVTSMVNLSGLSKPVAVTPCHQSQPSSSQTSTSCQQHGSKYLSLLTANQLFMDDSFALLCFCGALVLASLIWADLLFKPPRRC